MKSLLRPCSNAQWLRFRPSALWNSSLAQTPNGSLRLPSRLLQNVRCSARRSYAVKQRPSTSSSVIRKSTPKPTDYLPPSASYAAYLAARPSPTLLFQAPQSTSYAVACYGLGSFCIIYGAYNFYDAFLVPHPGLWLPIPYFMGGVCIFVFGAGIWVTLSARRLVRSIHALPLKAATRSPVPTTRAATQDLARSLLVRIDLPPTIPFLSRAQSIDVRPDQLRLVQGIQLVRNPDLEAAGGIANKRIDALEQADRRQADRAKELESLSNPFTHLPKQIGRGFTWLAGSMRRIVSREGFVKILIDGKTWRLDVRDGWVLDEGVALERLLRK